MEQDSYPVKLLVEHFYSKFSITCLQYKICPRTDTSDRRFEGGPETKDLNFVTFVNDPTLCLSNNRS